jgi:hypothetical protein
MGRGIARDKDEIAFTNALTQLQRVDAWAGQNCDKANDYLLQAEAEAKSRPVGAAKDEQIAFIGKWHTAMASCINGAATAIIC